MPTASLPRVSAILPGLIPSTVISIVKPLLALHRAGQITATVTLEALATVDDVDAADLVVFCRNTEPRFGHFAERCLDRGTPYVYDLDDNFFVVPSHLEEGRYHNDPIRLEQLRRYVAGAALVRVYSEPVRRRVLDHNDHVAVVTPSLDWSLLPPSLPPRRDGPVRILYATSRLKDELAAIFMPAVEAALERRLGVEVCFWGFHPEGFRKRRGIRLLPLEGDYDRFLGRLGRSGFDIGLAPLADTEFHRSKTNNKFREYGAAGIAGLYSNVEVYSSCVRDGETGLLVDNDPEAWRAALDRLIDDAELRERIRWSAREEVHRRYSQERAAGEWLAQIRELLHAGGGRVLLRSAGSQAKGPPQGRAALFDRFRGLAGRSIRLFWRIRDIGLRPTVSWARRYVEGLRLLRRIRKELARPRPLSSQPGNANGRGL